MISGTHPHILLTGRLAEVAAAGAATAEVNRRVGQELIALLRDTGIGSMGIPRSLGGTEPDVAGILEAIRLVAEGDGSAGWVTMIYSTSSVGAHYFSPEASQEVYASGSSTLLAGVLAPRGSIEAVDGGFLLSGRWPFASGCVDADWISLGALDDQGRVRSYLLPMGEVEIIDTWDVIGLRASASHDVAVRDCLIPHHRVVDLAAGPRTEEAPARFPIYGLLAAGIGAVCLGIARNSIDHLIELAGAKTPTGSKRRLAERAAVQEAVARAEAMVGAAREYLFDAVAGASPEVTLNDRVRLRNAATHAVEASRAAVDLTYGLAGGSAVYAESSLQRCFRDVHTAAQHMMVSQPTWELTGRVLLGMETDTSQL